MGKQESLFNTIGPLRHSTKLQRLGRSKQDIDDTLISRDSQGHGGFKGGLRRSVQNKVREKKGYQINFGAKSHKKNYSNIQANKLERELRKIGDSKRDALDTLSNYSSMTSDVQKRIKKKLNDETRKRKRVSRGVSRENRLSLRKSMISRSPKGLSLIHI